MRRYSVSIITLCLILLQASCNNQEKPQQWSVQTAKTPEVEFKFELTKDCVEQLDSWYRLKPDQRFIKAIPEIHHFFTDEPKQEVVLQFKNNLWHISYGGNEIGSLSELPDFQEFMELLTTWVSSLQQDNPVEFSGETPTAIYHKIKIDIDRFLKSNVITALQEIDSRWNGNKYEKELLPLASRGLTYLAVQQYDKMEIADQVYAKAIAFLAIAKNLTTENMLRCESLLAYTLDYSNHAVSTSENFPKDNPVKNYVRNNLQLLKDSYDDKKESSEESRYLTLLTLARQQKPEEFLNWMNLHYPDDWYSLPLLKASLEIESFSQSRAQASVVPLFVIIDIMTDVLGDKRLQGELREFRQDNDSHKNDTSELVDSLMEAIASDVVENFELNLNYVGSQYTGPFLDAFTYKEFYKGYFYSSLYKTAYFYLKMLSSVEAAQNFSAYLGKSTTGIAGDIQKWFNHLVASKAGIQMGEEFMQDLVELENIGAAPLAETVDELLKYFDYGDPSKLDLVKMITARMDTRINHRIRLGYYSYNDLYDVRMAFALHKSVVEAASQTNSNITAWLARKEKDYSTLVKMLYSDDTDLLGLINILIYLQSHLELKEVEKEYDRVIKMYPDNLTLRTNYSEFLRRNKRFRKAEKTLRDWEKRDVLTTGLEHIVVKVYLSDIYYDQGKYGRAYNTIEPKISSYKADAMFRGVKCLYKLARKEEGDELAEKLISRYPDGFDHRLNVAGLYWEYGKHSEASYLLKEYPYTIAASTWQNDIASRFYFSLENKSENEVLAAFDDLIQNGFPPIYLRYIAYKFHQHENNELAFKMVTRMQAPKMGNFLLQLNAYEYMLEYTDKDEALAWLKRNVQVPDLNPLSMILYQEGNYDLLWDFIDEPEKGSYPSSVWLIRAAAYVTDSEKNNIYGKKLRAYFNNDPPDHYFLMGKYLMDFATKEELLTDLDTYEKLCEMSYFIGIKEAEKGNNVEAVKLFRICLETKLVREVERNWAFDYLYKEYVATFF